MQLIAVDIGNSSTKVAVEHLDDGNRWWVEQVFRGDSPSQFTQPLGQTAFWSVSSVNSVRLKELTEWIKENRPGDQLHIISPDDVPMDSAVESREQLGRDRLLAAWQALNLNESGPLIVIDAGTAVTVDFVDESGVFQGGMIYPGAMTNLKSLSIQTDALPDVSAKLKELRTNSRLGFIGRSTDEAIMLGVFQSHISALKVAVDELSKSPEGKPLSRKPAVYITGGGIRDIVHWLPQEWQHVTDLVLQAARTVGRQIMNRQASSE